jgi:hypothetical protein
MLKRIKIENLRGIREGEEPEMHMHPKGAYACTKAIQWVVVRRDRSLSRRRTVARRSRSRSPTQ